MKDSKVTDTGKRSGPPWGIILRCVVIAAVLALIIFRCTNLRYENVRTSDVIPPLDVTQDLGVGDEVVQPLFIDEGEDKLFGVALLYADQNINPQGTVRVKVYCDGNVIGEWTAKGEYIRTSECEYYRFEKPWDTKGHKFEAHITFEGFGDAKPFVMRTGSSDKNAPATVNGNVSTGVLCYMNLYDQVSLWQMVAVPSAIFLVFIGLQCLWHFVIRKKFKLCDDADFIAAYVTLVLMYFVFVPIQSISDEGYHFLRVYTIAHGDVIAQVSLNDEGGGDVPEAVAQFADEGYRNLFHNGKRMGDEPLKNLVIEGDTVRPYGFSNTAINMPLMYLPQIIGVGLSDIITNRPYVMAYAGRLCNMVAVVLLVILSVKITPSGKGYFKLTAFLPIMMQQTVSLAPDAFITALIMLYLALILRARFDLKGELKTKHYAALYVLTIVIVLCKMVYAPLCLLLFLIPKEKFGKPSRYYTAILFFALSVITFVMSWMMVVSRYNMKFYRADSSMQLRFILDNPLKASGLFADYILDAGRYFTELFGGDIGFLNIPIPSFVALVFIIIAVLWCGRMERSPKAADYAGRFIPALIVIVVYMLIGLSEYMGWTKVGASAIFGVSGRYFLPIVPVFLFAMSGIRRDGEVSLGFREKTTFASVLMNLTAIVSFWIYTVF